MIERMEKLIFRLNIDGKHHDLKTVEDRGNIIDNLRIIKNQQE